MQSMLVMADSPGRGRWSELALPYRLTQPTTDLPGGHLTIDPGAIVEATDPGAALRFPIDAS